MEAHPSGGKGEDLKRKGPLLTETIGDERGALDGAKDGAKDGAEDGAKGTPFLA